MGLFDIFKKDKGKELFTEQTPAEKKAEAIRKEIERHNIKGDIEVYVEGNRVKIKGSVPDQKSREMLMVITGNTKHIDSVDDGDLQGGDGSEGRFHTVESGETLSAIAKEYYGNANDYMKIFNANQPMLDDPDKIYPGQVLRVPREETAQA